MKFEEIKEKMNNTKADCYPRDRKGWFEAFEGGGSSLKRRGR